MILMTAHVGYCTRLRLQQAVIKAMLNSPTADQGGFQNLFSVVELRHLAQREAKLMQRVKEANESIILVDTYLRAYGKFPQQVLQRLVSVLEVKCVMHAFNKKSETRTSYANFVQVTQSVVDDAKRLDPSLPVLPVLAKSEDASASSKKHPNKSLRQHGKVPDAIIEAKGFKVGAIVHESGRGTNHITRSRS